MSIDTEGNELKIVQSIDFDKFDIKLFTIENNYNDKQLQEFMLSKNYKYIGRLEADEVFIKNQTN